jgi:hypothetical protein
MCKKDMSAFPSMIRANPDLWKQDLIAEVFDISRVGLGIPQKVSGLNHTLKYLSARPIRKKDENFWNARMPASRTLLRGK